jgi:DNA mismatch repair protein MutS2
MLAALLDPRVRGGLDGEALVRVRGWVEAGTDTRAAWADPQARERHPRLSALADVLPDLAGLASRLRRALDDDGAVRDEASTELARARRGVRDGERRLHQQLERWAAGFGEGSYVTRHGERFVALVPAAGFSRRRGIVHDTSNSGQSLFVEPLEACEGNNALMELRGVAAEEERRILRELGESVWTARDALLATEATLAALDDLRARARWASRHGGIALRPGEGALRLVRARHPLLAMAADAAAVVPLDLVLEPDGRLLLVSGPNMGGKTVLLKTVGLAVAMAHAALPVLAAEGSTVPVIDTVLVDLGDEQSVDQGLSTFAAHLRRLRAMTDAAGPHALLLVDELGAGTDPEEGAALGRALLEHFAQRQAWGVVTTHLGSLKRVAGEVAGIVNGSLEFDLATLRSRHRFVPGVPGASHALDVAGQLGFPPALLARARDYTSDETRALERLLSELGALRAETTAERERLEQARLEAERAAQHHRETAEEAKRSLAQLRRQLTAESDTLLARARGLWQEVQREARKGEKSRERVQALRDGLEQAEQGATELQRRVTPEPEAPPAAPPRIVPGARVRVLDLGVEAEVVSGPEPDGRVQLRRGSLRIQSHVNRLAAVGTAAVTPATRPTPQVEATDDAPAFEVDLRGMESDEALRAVDQALDRAVVAGFHELRIIHGIGRGVLQAAVQRHLRGHPQVESQRLGGAGEGGRGATVARLR